MKKNKDFNKKIAKYKIFFREKIKFWEKKNSREKKNFERRKIYREKKYRERKKKSIPKKIHPNKTSIQKKKKLKLQKNWNFEKTKTLTKIIFSGKSYLLDIAECTESYVLYMLFSILLK